MPPPDARRIPTFFRDLLAAAAPSGDERAAARVWRGYASDYADVGSDALGSSWATTGPADGPRPLVVGHVDEIGLVITHVDDDGYAWFAPVGGWDAEVLVGQRVRILAAEGPVTGVVGKKSRHLQEGDERDEGRPRSPALDRHRPRRRRVGTQAHPHRRPGRGRTADRSTPAAAG